MISTIMKTTYDIIIATNLFLFCLQQHKEIFAYNKLIKNWITQIIKPYKKKLLYLNWLYTLNDVSTLLKLKLKPLKIEDKINITTNEMGVIRAALIAIL